MHSTRAHLDSYKCSFICLSESKKERRADDAKNFYNVNQQSSEAFTAYSRFRKKKKTKGKIEREGKRKTNTLKDVQRILRSLSPNIRSIRFFLTASLRVHAQR